MLTIFAVPKPFEGHIGTIQRNAIGSWTRIAPPCQIVLLGNEAGTRQVARDFGIRHEPTLEVNEYGTPLVSDLFARAESVSDSATLCYVNADIILFSDLMTTVRELDRQRRPILIVGRRTDLDITKDLRFQEGWQDQLRSRARVDGHLHGTSGIDYFVFRRGLFGEVPPFALGRTYWDNWLLYRARARGARLIDVSTAVLAIHQNHGYGTVGKDGIWSGPESQRNRALGGSLDFAFTIDDATHAFDGTRLRSTLLRPSHRRKIETAARCSSRWGWLLRPIVQVLDATHAIRKRIGLASIGVSRDP